ncbi:helix-turn-helix transcriptional regulator [Lactobacillus sp. ESL0681]|uniref:helix-turn-helix domain-containing protein n=1 Tax=Lactobacillus sp. ESL0681 TaxID=2983211 RepID=UPI0023F976A5|nr:helix-turn-helix transcriptional regulator [Lactobacillus sp. ESL0681]WEV40316.1 helix-turn-helix transcriptional regulator [Lactobacillus sp. ESL0681]
MTTFERLKELASERKMTLSYVNDKAGLGKNSIYHWKTKTPSTENLQKVAKVLHTSTDYLLGNTDDPSPVSKDHRAIDIENDELLSYRGRPIPDDYLDIIKNLMDSDIQHGRKR